MSRVAALAVLLLLATVSAGCAISAKSAIRETITEYNELLPEAYSRPDPELLTPLTTDAELNRVDMYILYLKKNEELLDSRLLELEFVSVEIEEGDDRATVVTTEKWEYRMLDAETREPKGDYAAIAYESTYLLKLEDGEWVVADLSVDESPLDSSN